MRLNDHFLIRSQYDELPIEETTNHQGHQYIRDKLDTIYLGLAFFTYSIISFNPAFSDYFANRCLSSMI